MMQMKQDGTCSETWTELRTHIQKTINECRLGIEALGIYEWQSVEQRIVTHFTGEKSMLTWMWENEISDNFEHFAKQMPEYSVLSDVLLKVIEYDEMLWLFLEDSLHERAKFWGYSGKIESIVTLLGELPPLDFYIVPKKLEWVLGQNHHDILFGYGKIANKLMQILRRNRPT
jgi:hypothetical protein